MIGRSAWAVFRLRLATGIFQAGGVKTNVLFFDAKPAQEAAWTSKRWVVDPRTNRRFTRKTKPLKRADLDEFVECFDRTKRQKRKRTWTEKRNPEGRWRAFDYEELMKRDKVNLDIFWLKDKSLEDSDDLPEPDLVGQEIADDSRTALDRFTAIEPALKKRGRAGGASGTRWGLGKPLRARLVDR